MPIFTESTNQAKKRKQNMLLFVRKVLSLYVKIIILLLNGVFIHFRIEGRVKLPNEIKINESIDLYQEGKKERAYKLIDDVIISMASNLAQAYFNKANFYCQAPALWSTLKLVVGLGRLSLLPPLPPHGA